MLAVQRPTLPPLSSLQLPTLASPTGSMVNHTRLQTKKTAVKGARSHSRRVSISSSVTSTSRSPSPPRGARRTFITPMSLRTPSPSPPPSPPTPMPLNPSSSSSSGASTSGTFRLVPARICQADAILFVPPPLYSHPPSPTMSQLSSVPSISQLSRHSSYRHHAAHSAGKTAKALLLVGPAMNHLHGPDGVRRQLALGARIHAYKIVRNSDGAASAKAVTPLVPVRDVRTVGLCN